jgi:hypothetical protein
VWSALRRKGLANVGGPVAVTLTAEGMSYDAAPAPQQSES